MLDVRNVNNYFIGMMDHGGRFMIFEVGRMKTRYCTNCRSIAIWDKNIEKYHCVVCNAIYDSSEENITEMIE